MNRLLLYAAGLGALTMSCRGPSSHRNPIFAQPTAPPPTLLTSTVACLDKAVVAAGGQLVKRSTGFGEELTQKLDMRVARIGDTTPAFPVSLCFELASEQALNGEDWHNPKAPPILAELATMAGAQTVFVPVVVSRMECGSSPKPWIWGRPAYEDERGDVDCVERKLVVIGYLFDQHGALLWKSVQEHDLHEVPDTADLANQLMLDAPIEKAASLKPNAPVASTAPKTQ